MKPGILHERERSKPRNERAGARRTRSRRAFGRPPGSSGEETRQRIVDAARVCFGEYGYKDTSNRVIADSADLTPALIYHYFDNKQHLFLAVQEQTQNEIQAAVWAALDPLPATFAEATARFLKSLLEFHLTNPGHSKFNAMVRMEALRNPDIARARDDRWWRDAFRRMSDLGVRTGEVARSDARFVRHALSSAVLGLTQQGIELDKRDVVESSLAMTRLFQGTLSRRPRGQGESGE